MINTSKLRAKIVENGLTYQALSQMMGISSCTFGRKIKNISDTTLPEAAQIINILNIPKSEITEYFFLGELEEMEELVDEEDDENDEDYGFTD